MSESGAGLPSKARERNLPIFSHVFSKTGSGTISISAAKKSP